MRSMIHMAYVLSVTQPLGRAFQDWHSRSIGPNRPVVAQARTDVKSR